jgi:hypothetical protein
LPSLTINNWTGYSLEQQRLDQEQNQASTPSTRSALVARELREGIFIRAGAREEFRRERSLPNGWVLNTKEELMYYRVF